MPDPHMSFLPEDYVERRIEQRTNIICLSLFAIVLIAVVGDGLLRRKGVAARIFSSVSTAGVNVEMISTGASEAAAYFIVRDADADRAVEALHREFFERRHGRGLDRHGT